MTRVWHDTTIVVVAVTAGDTTGLGYTYGHPAHLRKRHDEATGLALIDLDAEA